METEIYKRLEKMEHKLDGITDALTKIAVQKNRLDNLTDRVNGLWNKWDNQVSPTIQGCPKEQVRWLWFIVIPMALTQLSLGFALMRIAFK